MDHPHHDMRHEMRSGDLVFRDGSLIADRLIEMWTSSPLSHVGVVYRVPGDVRIMQAVESGVGPVTLDHFESLGPCWWLPTGVAPAWTTAIEARMMALAGKPYSIPAELAVSIGAAPASGEEICTTLCAEILGFCGLKIDTRGLTPAALANWFSARGHVLIALSP